MELEVQLKDQIVPYKNKYWNEHRKNHCQKKAYEAKEDFCMRGALVMLGKKLDEVKTDYKESLQLLNERIKKLEAAKKDLQHKQTILR